MSTKLVLSFALVLGLPACLLEIEEDETVLSPEDQETPPDLASDITSDLTGEATDPQTAGDENSTCGGQPRKKADGPCVPN